MKRPLRYIRFWSFLAVFGIGALAFAKSLGIARAMLLGFDLGAVLFIVSTIAMMSRAGPHQMRERAAANDADHHILLIIGALIVVVILVAVWVELTGTAGHKGLALGTAAATLLIAWVFSNLLAMLHYAHLYYVADDGEDSGGLEFPKEPTPDYGDFAYYAFVLGMTFQVSDVQITARPIRRLAMWHGLAAFLFNIVVVALSVSLLGGLLQ